MLRRAILLWQSRLSKKWLSAYKNSNISETRQGSRIKDQDQGYYWGPIGSHIRAFEWCNNQRPHRVVCPFTPQLSLVLINRPRRDGTLSWRWYTAAVGRIRTGDSIRHRTTRPPRTVPRSRLPLGAYSTSSLGASIEPPRECSFFTHVIMRQYLCHVLSDRHENP